MPSQATMLSIYRQRNAPVLERLIEPALNAGWDVRLWALDAPDERLEAFTAGSGPGSKFDLLNDLADDPIPPDHDVVVADDDVAFVRGTAVTFIDLANQADLGIAQPAHSLRSHRSHRVTVRRPLSRARLTTFVEIGPMFAVSRQWRGRVLPFPEGIGMGWGLELRWMDLRGEGCRLGIVDAYPIRHLTPVGAAYVPQQESERLARLLAERGVPGAVELRWRELQRTLATWRPWQRRAPWTRVRRGNAR